MAIIYQTVAKFNISQDDGARVIKRQFSSEKEAKASLLEQFQADFEDFPADARVNGTINDGDFSGDFTEDKYVVLDEYGNSFWGIEMLEDTDMFYIEKIPGQYALLSLNSEVFDYPTDLIGQFSSLRRATKAGSSLIQELLDNGEITEDEFNEYPQLAIFLVPANGYVDYWNGCSWDFKIHDNKPVVKEK